MLGGGGGGGDIQFGVLCECSSPLTKHAMGLRTCNLLRLMYT